MIKGKASIQRLAVFSRSLRPWLVHPRIAGGKVRNVRASERKMIRQLIQSFACRKPAPIVATTSERVFVGRFGVLLATQADGDFPCACLLFGLLVRSPRPSLCVNAFHLLRSKSLLPSFA